MSTTIDTEFRPIDWEDYVGQEQAKDRLQVAMLAAMRSKRPLGHVLLAAPPGSGKSTLANLIAEEMNEQMVEVSEPPTPRRLGHYLFELEAGGILFVDEIHEHKSIWNTLHTLCEAGTYSAGHGVWEFPHLTVIGATTEVEKLPKSLIDRFPIKPTFTAYSEVDMAMLVAGFADKVDLFLDEPTCMALGRAAAGTPRIARGLVEAARDLNQADRPITADAILAFEQIATDGLTLNHIAYLRALSANFGRSGLDALTTRLRLNKGVVTDLERLLMERGLISLDSTGRILTTAGMKRLKAAP